MKDAMVSERAESPPSPFAAPDLHEVRALREVLYRYIARTPVWDFEPPESATVPEGARLVLKLELLQKTGSFKIRGAMSAMLELSAEQLRRGVVAASAGNHAVAVAHAARLLGSNARICVPRSANPLRLARCKELGARLELCDSIAQAFARCNELREQENYSLVHPFDGPAITRGTATLGMELAEQVEDLEAVVVPIGGGGLCSGVAAALKALVPPCKVYGVEPRGADAMTRSLSRGAPAAIERVDTIADSLGAPYTLPYSFELCRRYTDDVVTVDDAEIVEAMKLLFERAKLAVEPAAAAPLAAALGPLRQRLQGRRVALVLSGSNIDMATFLRIMNAPGR